MYSRSTFNTVCYVPYRCDQDGDGKISYMEFTKFLTSEETHLLLSCAWR